MPMNPRLLRPTAGTGFDPRKIVGLEAWWDASDASTITLNGSNVSEWRDKSGKGRHASQVTGANQPAYSPTSWSGRPSVNFTRSSSHFLSFTPFVLTTQTVFLVIEPTGSVTSNTGPTILNIAGSNAGELNRWLFINATNYRTYTAVLGAAVTGTPAGVGADIFAEKKMLISHTYNNAGSTTVGNHGLRESRSSVSVDSSGVVAAGTNAATIGCRFAANNFSEFISARYASIIIYSRVLSATEIEAVENWASSRYSL
jgi:hypothetical protein